MFCCFGILLCLQQATDWYTLTVKGAPRWFGLASSLRSRDSRPSTQQPCSGHRARQWWNQDERRQIYNNGLILGGQWFFCFYAILINVQWLFKVIYSFPAIYMLSNTTTSGLAKCLKMDMWSQVESWGWWLQAHNLKTLTPDFGNTPTFRWEAELGQGWGEGRDSLTGSPWGHLSVTTNSTPTTSPACWHSPSCPWAFCCLAPSSLRKSGSLPSWRPITKKETELV